MFFYKFLLCLIFFGAFWNFCLTIFLLRILSLFYFFNECFLHFCCEFFLYFFLQIFSPFFSTTFYLILSFFSTNFYLILSFFSTNFYFIFVIFSHFFFIIFLCEFSFIFFHAFLLYLISMNFSKIFDLFSSTV